MAYIGKQPEIDGDATDIIVDTITGNGSTTTMTVSSVLAPASVNNISVFVAGLMQVPGTDYTLSSKTITFTTAPANGLKVVAISHVDTFSSAYANAFATGHGNLSIKDASVTNDHIDSMSSSKLTGALPAGSGANLTNLSAANLTGTVADARISTLTASKLTGALPAISGANVTGIPSVSITKNSSDPALTTNPSGGVGTLWSNSTTGEAFVCTDATSNENVWTNVGGGTGDVAPFSWMGTTSGYTAGGRSSNVIDKFSFTSDGNATDVGDLSATQGYPSGHHSATAGYIAGTATSKLDKMTFASEGNSTDVANIAQVIDSPCNHSTSTHGWIAGTYGNDTTMIMKFTFATDSDAVDSTKNLSTGRGYTASSQDGETYGYVASGNGTASDIDRYSFSDSNHSSDVGSLNGNSWGGGWVGGGSSSATHGYVMGAGDSQPATNHIEKYSFASSSNGADVGNLTESRRGVAGTGSTTNIYAVGGYAGAGPSNSNYKYTIDKRATASDGDSSDIGDLTYNRHGAGEFQK